MSPPAAAPAGASAQVLTTAQLHVLGSDPALAAPPPVAREVPRCSPDDSAADVLESMRGRTFDSADAVAVLDADARLAGLVPIARLLAAEPETRAAELGEAAVPVASGRAAPGLRMLARDPTVIAIVDRDRRLVGLLPPRRLLGPLLEAHQHDLARIGGLLHGSLRARRAAEERVAMRLWHRLPWLLVGLLGAMASVALVSGFERQLDQTVLIAFFLPAVVYMADAVGTQTEALMIRALSVEVGWRRSIRRELWSGLAIGILVGAAFVPFAAVGWGDGAVALAVGLSLLAACSTATAVAMFLPLILQRLGLDPAFGSGPLATVLQDLISIAIYLGIAVAVVG